MREYVMYFESLFSNSLLKNVFFYIKKGLTEPLEHSCNVTHKVGSEIIAQLWQDRPCAAW